VEIMRDAISTQFLVHRAALGDGSAWNEIVRLYTPLVRSVCWRFGLSGMDAEDVGSTVWMRLLSGITCLREPAALPGWLRTTTRRECQTLLRGRDRDAPPPDGEIADPHTTPSDARLLAEEQMRALHTAVVNLSESDRRLLGLLFSDPPTSYAEISLALGMPVGAIGPTRQRVLNRLRRQQVWRVYELTG
jgi:RNA polymerase sigma factor (sigma-70 family)